MKKITLFILSVVLLSACAESPKSDNTATTSQDVTVLNTVLPIAVINYDTLLATYEFAIVSSEALISKQENARVELGEKARQLQNEMVDFQRKIENNAFMSRERAEQEQRRLMKKETDLQELEQRLTQELMLDQQKMTEQLRESLETVVAEINKDGKYQLILTTNAMNDNVLFCAPQYDITAQVVALMNKNYKK